MATGSSWSFIVSQLSALAWREHDPGGVHGRTVGGSRRRRPDICGDRPLLPDIRREDRGLPRPDRVRDVL